MNKNDFTLKEKVLLSQIYTFLQKNKSAFVKDPEFSVIKTQLVDILGEKQETY